MNILKNIKNYTPSNQLIFHTKEITFTNPYTIEIVATHAIFNTELKQTPTNITITNGKDKVIIKDISTLYFTIVNMNTAHSYNWDYVFYEQTIEARVTLFERIPDRIIEELFVNFRANITY